MSDKLVALALGFVLTLVRWLPRGAFDAAGTALARLVRPFAGKDLAQLRRNVQAIYGLPPRSSFARLFERQVLRHQMTCALETLRIIQEPALLTLVGETEVKAAVAAAEAAGRGHLVVTAHLGSWELCAAVGQRAATRQFHVLAKPPRRRAAMRFLTTLRERMGVQVLWTDRKSLLKDMLAALRRGESVGFVMDQKPEGRKGPVVPFLGIDTEFVSGPAAMAARTGAAVITLFCVREGPFRYRAIGEPLVPGGHAETDETALTARMADAIGRAVSLYPEQWTWSYKRWRWPPTPDKLPS